jgi:hypothetical protein
VATEDKRRDFDDIIDRLTTDYPSLRRMPWRWRRSTSICVLVAGALAWGLLSVAMVAWGWKGVVLTCVVVFLTGVVAAVDSHRHRLTR